MVLQEYCGIYNAGLLVREQAVGLMPSDRVNN